MQRIRLTLEYDGRSYSGWQYQKDQPSVQESLEKALFTIFKMRIRVTAAGRTDAGVHARNQVVHVDIPEYDLRQLKGSLNGILNRDIAVKKIRCCESDFHARFSARARQYSYTISTKPTAIKRNYAWTVLYPLNISLMQRGAELICLYSDFQSFCKVRSEVKHYLCDIIFSRWVWQDDFLIFEIKANRFLHGMVRSIVGTLVELGRGKINIPQMREMIEAKDRKRVPYAAPAQGLVLEQIYY